MVLGRSRRKAWLSLQMNCAASRGLMGARPKDDDFVRRKIPPNAPPLTPPAAKDHGVAWTSKAPPPEHLFSAFLSSLSLEPALLSPSAVDLPPSSCATNSAMRDPTRTAEE